MNFALSLKVHPPLSACWRLLADFESFAAATTHKSAFYLIPSARSRIICRQSQRSDFAKNGCVNTRQGIVFFLLGFFLLPIKMHCTLEIHYFEEQF
jgi:hypothetical protein